MGEAQVDSHVVNNATSHNYCTCVSRPGLCNLGARIQIHFEEDIMAGQNTTPVTDQTFDKDVLQASVPVLVDFWAEWCGPCKALGPKLEEIAGELKDTIKIAKMNVDENPAAPAKYGVRGIPTMILFKNGKEVDQIVGNHPKENILAMLKKYS